MSSSVESAAGHPMIYLGMDVHKKSITIAVCRRVRRPSGCATWYAADGRSSTRSSSPHWAMVLAT